MAKQKFIGGDGVGSTFTSAFSTATLNSIANGNAILSDLQIDNSSALDIFCDVSFAGGSITTVSPAYIGIFLYPLLSDGATYGDGRFGTSAAGPPPGNYAVGQMAFPVGTQALSGAVRGIVMPPGKFKFVLYNQAGAALAASGNTLTYRTYNFSIT